MFWVKNLTNTERALKRILEKYEKRLGFPNSLLSYKGLTIADGFNKKFLNVELVSARGDSIFKDLHEFLDEILAQPHFSDLEQEKNMKQQLNVQILPKRKVRLKTVVIELEVENFLEQRMEKQEIIISPFKKLEDSYLMIFLEDPSREYSVRSSLEAEKDEIESEFSH